MLTKTIIAAAICGIAGLSAGCSSAGHSNTLIYEADTEQAADLTPSRALASNDGALLSSVWGYGYPFEVRESGELNEIRVGMEVSESVAPKALVVLHIHEELDGMIGRPIARMIAELSADEPAEPLSVIAPHGVFLDADRRYWLVADSPTGAEILWRPSRGKSQRFYKNVINGERGLEPASKVEFDLFFVAPEETATAEAGSAPGDA